MVTRLKPSCFEDIVAILALYRPGPLMRAWSITILIESMGERWCKYPHPVLEPILKDTHGIILYQEQIMQIAQAMGGYTLGPSILRRAMGKKKWRR